MVFLWLLDLLVRSTPQRNSGVSSQPLVPGASRAKATKGAAGASTLSSSSSLSLRGLGAALGRRGDSGSRAHCAQGRVALAKSSRGDCTWRWPWHVGRETFRKH